MLGTPWHPDPGLAAPVRARVAEIHLLDPEAPTHGAELGCEAAVEALLAHAFAPVHLASVLNRLLQSTRRVAEQVSVRRTAAVTDAGVVSFGWGQRQASLAFAPPSVS